MTAARDCGFVRAVGTRATTRPRSAAMLDARIMSDPVIRFDDGAAYERMMGTWSQLAGNAFLDWLAPSPGLRWIDVGCGTGAFTQLIADRCAPADLHGVDPAEGQLAFARTRPASRVAAFHSGNAMALPFPDDRFDAAVMALVLFYAPDPAVAVGEMVRVVRPGGLVTAYVWDFLGGGAPTEPIQSEMRAMGIAVPAPPSPAASRLEVMQSLWAGAGLTSIDNRELCVSRTFADFEDFWGTTLLQPNIGPPIAALPDDQRERLKAWVRASKETSPGAAVTCTARANAIQGRKPLH